MKQLLLIFMMAAIATLAFAGIDEFYTFNATTGTYTAITGTAITSILGDDMLSELINIGFNFPYGEDNFTQVRVSSNGWVGLGTSLTHSNLTNQLSSLDWRPVLAPLWDDTSLSGGNCQYLLSGTAPNRIFTIQYSGLQWNYYSGNSHELQVRLYENGKVDFIYGVESGAPQNASASIGINMAPGGVNWFYSVTPGPPATVSQTVENSSISTYPALGTIYEFLPLEPAENDLAAVGLVGNTTPSVGTPSNYTVSIRNRGSNPQTTYQVKLITSTNVELVSIPGTPIQPGEVIDFTLTWTPTEEGPLILRGKVVLAGDENPNNDLTQPLSITVMPAGVVVITIGAGDQQAQIPVNMWWRNSLYETLYYPAEITMVGNIMALSFYNNFQSNLPNMPTRIWLGTTQNPDLAAGWIPSTQLTLVFDGNVNYPSGQNTIMIPLQTVYTYTGGNLVMMVQRPMDTQYYSSMDYFYCQTVGTNRARDIYSDSTTYDPANPPAGATVSGQFPKTSIHLTPLGTDPLAIISPDNLNYGQALMGTTHTRQLTILNGGGGTLGITSITISGSPFFSIANMPNLPASLVTGQTIPLNVVYAPTAAGTHTGTITITDDQNRIIHTVPLTATCIDPTIYSLPYAQNFDNVTAPNIPLDWTVINQANNTTYAYLRTITDNSYSPPNNVAFYNYDDASATQLLIAPPYATDIQTNTTRVNFRGRAASNGYTISVGIMTDSQNPASFTEIQSVPLTTTWTEYVVTFGGYTGNGRFVAFKHGLGGTYLTVYVDNVMLEVIPDNDLAAIAVSGNQTPSVGNATAYTVSVFNWGTNTQSNYTVKLFDSNDVELASAPGETVTPGQTVMVQVMWTPALEGPTAIYGKVVLAGDQNPLNDASPPLNITVMPAGMVVITVGTGNELALMPVNMFWMNSLFETLYYPQEMGMFGAITALTFYNNFQTNLPNKPTKIWLGSTQINDLSGGWIPSTQLTLVFDGNVNYPSGQNAIVIPLQTPYMYMGGNLVMMVNRPMDTTYFSSLDLFQCQTIGTNRTRHVYADGTQFFPDNPPATANITGQFPKTSFHMTPPGNDPIFMVNPDGCNFGTALLNSTHDQNFMVMNVGGGVLTINTISIAGSEHFSLQNLPTLPASLNTGQSLNFTGRYHPTAVGEHSAVITINDDQRFVLGNRTSGDRNREPHTVNLTGTCVDPTITQLPYMQNFDAVTAPALPVQWTTIIQGTGSPQIQTTSTTPYTPPNCVMMNNSSDVNATLILVAPPYANTINTNTTRTNFYARSAGANYTLSVGVLTDAQNPATYTEIQTISLTTTWTEYVVTFGAYTGTGRVIAFKHGLGGTSRSIYLDNIMLEVIPQDDLAALSVQGNVTPSVGAVTNYIVTVFNWGSNAQNDYQVKLYQQGDIELGSSPGVQINPGQTVQVSVAWTPTQEGATTIYGKVVLTGDQNPINDISPPLNVVVQPQGLVVLTIGEGNQTGRFPVDMYYMNSLFECVYYPAELSNTIGLIYGVGFYNSFSTNLPNMPTRVWLGTTTQPDLSAGWIPSTELTQVFDGTVNYPSGQNLIQISFPQPFMYLTGGNLVMMVQRPMDTTYYSSLDVFQTQTIGTTRARNVYADGTAFDPANPPTTTASGAFPKTSFYIIPGGVGHITGTVYGAGGQPLPGVAVQFATGGYSTTTNAQGQYGIQNIIADEYQVTFSRYGYIDQTQNVTIPEDETVVLDINLQQMPVVTVGGTIVASDTGTGLSGAGIYLTGYENYSTTTNTQGIFTIPSVYANQTYDYTIICPGYQNAAGTINVGSTNYSFGTITLNEVAYAPRQVHGEINDINTAVEVTWLAPDPSALDVVESFEGTTFPPQNWTQVVTNNGPPNTNGVYPTWCRFGTITISGTTVAPTDGVYQGGLWWSYDHQDEWLITPIFNCPPSAYLRFDSYVYLGSVNGDHYYVKISTDDGNTWTTLWDASAQTGGWNYYASPITIDLTTYEGLQIKIAWHAQDPPSNDGLWYVWFIDDIYIGNAVTGVRFLPGDLNQVSALNSPRIQSADPALPLRASKAEFSSEPRQQASWGTAEPSPGTRNSTRALVGYKVWRLIPGHETNETSWNLITPDTITELSTMDTGWVNLPNGNYRWAVKAVYTSNVLSVPSFSNILQKEVISGFISGVVRTVNNAPIAGATVTADTYSATTNSIGAYSIVIPIGAYDVTASATGYISQTVEDVTVIANQATTVNFHLEAGSENEENVIPVTATALIGNYPNPFNPETTISYALKDPGRVNIGIYNLKGQLIRTLVNSDQPSGRYAVLWNGRDDQGRAVGSGIYYYRMQAKDYQATRRMILMQ